MYVMRILLLFFFSFNLFAATCDINNIVDEASGQFQRNRRQAMQKAKDLAGIPRGARLDKQYIVTGDVTKRGTPGYVYNANVTHQGRYYEYLDSQGNRKFIIEHTKDFDQGAGAHFHAARPQGANPYTNQRDYTLLGTDETGGTVVKKYMKIADNSGEHHIYYHVENP
tara:strand:+ start:13032 stop:13535 length:504 start_codon:yes stop_codon:yes gene_type:complete